MEIREPAAQAAGVRVDNIDQDDFETAFATASAVGEAPPPAEPAEPEVDPPETKPAEPAKVEEPAKALTPDAQLADALHRLRSAEGRITFLASQNERLTRETAAKPAPQSKPQQPAAATEEDDLLDKSPDLKAAFERRLRPLQEALDAAKATLEEMGGRVTKTAETVEPLAAKAANAELSTVWLQLDDKHAGWRDTINSTDFGAWLDKQVPAVRSMFETGRTFQESSAVLRLYAAEKPPAPPPPAPNPAPGRAVGIAPRAVVNVQPSNEDFEGAFAEAARQA